MTIRFVLGAAGAGKTHWCLDQICQALLSDPLEGEPLIFLVPEQATFQMERALLSHHPRITAAARARVMSFSRLAYSIIDEVGSSSHASASEFSSFLTMQMVVARNRHRLRIYGGAAQREGFIQHLGATFHELQAYQYTPDSLTAIQEVVGEQSLLGRKLHDLALLFSEYQAFSQARRHRWELPIEMATRIMPAALQLKGARVWIDGFSGFTPQEYAFLSALQSMVREMNVSLCIDPQVLGSDDPLSWEEGPVEALFHPTLETLVRLRDTARAKGWTMERPVLLGPPVLPRFRAAPLLGEIERAWATDQPATKRSDTGSGDAVVIIEAPDQRGEIEAVAREINRLIRDEGYRYRDIAVIARDLSVYRDTIETVLTQWGFPYFIDVKDPAHHHPLVVFIRSALDAVLTGLDADAVFRWLKTDLVPGVQRDDVDRLEDLCIRFGMRPKEWSPDCAAPRIPMMRMSDQERELAKGTLARGRDALAPIRTFYQGIDQLGEATHAHYADLLSTLLDDCLVAETMEGWSLDAQRTGQTSEANEHQQVLQGVLKLLDEIRRIIGDEPATFTEFCDTINAGLKQLRIAGVPPTVDQILVGAIDRSRQPDLKTAFLVGCNDGVFPAVPPEDPLFSDEDRSELSQVGLTLGPTSRLRLLHESYLVYIALTRAKHRIVMTYARTDRGGRPARPASFVSRLLREFPDIQYRLLPARQASFDWPERVGAIPGWLARAVRGLLEGDLSLMGRVDQLKAAWDWLESRSEASPATIINPLTALTYANHTRRLPTALTEILYGIPAVMSPSALESAAACLFQHFATYGIRLTPRQPFRFDPATLGTISHATLRRLVERLWAEKADLGEVRTEQLLQMTRASLKDVLERMIGDIDDVEAGNRFILDRLEQAIFAAVRVLQRHAERSAFNPAQVEVAFGEGRQLAPLKIELPGGGEVWIAGRIDRIDVAQHEDRTYLRVIDYKSSPKTFSLDEVAHGLDLQLVVYLLAAARAYAPQGTYRVAGALYLPVTDPLVPVSSPQSVEDLHWIKQLRASGIILDDFIGPQLMEKDLQGQSQLLPLYVKKDGALGSASSVADPEQMELLLDATEKIVARLAENVLAGHNEISPYRLGGKSPCAHCAVKPVCQFDPGLAGNRYRFLRKEKEGWQMLRQIVSAAKHAGGGTRDVV